MNYFRFTDSLCIIGIANCNQSCKSTSELNSQNKPEQEQTIEMERDSVHNIENNVYEDRDAEVLGCLKSFGFKIKSNNGIKIITHLWSF